MWWYGEGLSLEGTKGVTNRIRMIGSFLNREQDRFFTLKQSVYWDWALQGNQKRSPSPNAPLVSESV